MFGLGCFWGAERKFWQLGDGIWVTAVGYAGGITPNPTYEEVCSGRTGHNEVVRVVFDPAAIAYADLVKVFFESPRSDPGHASGQRRRHPVPLRHLYLWRRAADARRGCQPRLQPRAFGQRLWADHDRDRAERRSSTSPRTIISSISPRSRTATAAWAARDCPARSAPASPPNDPHGRYRHVAASQHCRIPGGLISPVAEFSRKARLAATPDAANDGRSPTPTRKLRQIDEADDVFNATLDPFGRGGNGFDTGATGSRATSGLNRAGIDHSAAGDRSREPPRLRLLQTHLLPATAPVASPPVTTANAAPAAPTPQAEASVMMAAILDVLADAKRKGVDAADRSTLAAFYATPGRTLLWVTPSRPVASAPRPAIARFARPPIGASSAASFDTPDRAGIGRIAGRARRRRSPPVAGGAEICPSRPRRPSRRQPARHATSTSEAAAAGAGRSAGRHCCCHRSGRLSDRSPPEASAVREAAPGAARRPQAAAAGCQGAGRGRQAARTARASARPEACAGRAAAAAAGAGAGRGAVVVRRQGSRLRCGSSRSQQGLKADGVLDNVNSHAPSTAAPRSPSATALSASWSTWSAGAGCPSDLGQFHVWDNVPEYRMRVMKDDKVVHIGDHHRRQAERRRRRCFPPT